MELTEETLNEILAGIGTEDTSSKPESIFRLRSGVD
jgi:hypothetical protein